jgi:hypothetical protein
MDAESFHAGLPPWAVPALLVAIAVLALATGAL